MAPKPDLLERLIKEIGDAIRVLRIRDGLPVTEEMCRERARNLATVLVVNFDMRPIPEIPLDWETPVISRPSPYVSSSDLEAMYAAGKPRAHLVTCRCDRCDEFNRRVRS